MVITPKKAFHQLFTNYYFVHVISYVWTKTVHMEPEQHKKIIAVAIKRVKKKKVKRESLF